jgi:Ser-tRNA(Ala) deacylase AlaX
MGRCHFHAPSEGNNRLCVKVRLDINFNVPVLRRTLREADQIAEFAFSSETFPVHARYRREVKQQRGGIMSQRSKVQEMVMQMHEKNVVLVNILRDIVENETHFDLSMEEDDEKEFCRKLNDRVTRRAEILAEIRHFLKREDLAKRVNA